jgi:hypothetical protein
MSIIKIDQSKLKAKADQERITELKKLLSDSDYKVLPDYDRTNDDIVEQRQAWREEIRSLENGE